ncbi:MAG: RodZ domain-containing protein [Gaiellaceae bacterium]
MRRSVVELAVVSLVLGCLAVTVFTVLLATGSFVRDAPVDEPTAVTTAPTATRTTDVASAPEPAAPEPAAPAPRPRASRPASSPLATAPAAPAGVVVAARTGDCWLQVRQGSSTGPIMYEGTLAQGSAVRFAPGPVWIRFGAAANVVVTVAGKPRALPSGTVDVVL